MKDQNGKVVFTAEKIYEVRNLHFPHNKTGYLGLNHWDITAMDQIDLGLDPHETDSVTHIVELPEDTEAVDIEATFNFLYAEGDTAVIHRRIKKIEF